MPLKVYPTSKVAMPQPAKDINHPCSFVNAEVAISRVGMIKILNHLMHKQFLFQFWRHDPMGLCFGHSCGHDNPWVSK